MDKIKNKVGRHSLGPNGSVVIFVRVPIELKAKLEKQAKTAGMKFSAFVRLGLERIVK
jgi:hypothetical protein